MLKSLIVAEKPSVASDIERALGGFIKGNGYYERDDAIVAAARGHLVELTVPEADGKGAWQLPSLPIIPSSFTLEISDGRTDEFNRLKKLMARDDVQDVVNACDAGREGELIFRLIYHKTGSRKPVRRMWIQSMIASAIRKAHGAIRPGAEFDHLYDAALCRAEAIWIVGCNGTRAATALLKQQTQRREVANVGRVQTPTLAMPVLREREIAGFIARDYWEIHCTFRATTGTYDSKWIGEGQGDDDPPSVRILDLTEARAIVDRCSDVESSCVTDDTAFESHAAHALFDLTTLQREANKRFKFLEKKHSTLPRRYMKHTRLPLTRALT